MMSHRTVDGGRQSLVYFGKPQDSSAMSRAEASWEARGYVPGPLL